MLLPLTRGHAVGAAASDLSDLMADVGVSCFLR